MKYKIYKKAFVCEYDEQTAEFNTIDECVNWLRNCLRPIIYVVVDNETNEWFDGQGLTATIQIDYSKLFFYRT